MYLHFNPGPVWPHHSGCWKYRTIHSCMTRTLDRRYRRIGTCWWNLSVPQHQPRPGQFLVQRPFFWSRIGYTSVWSPHIVILQHTRVKSEKLHTSEKNILFRLDGGTGNHVTTLPHTSNVLLFFAFIYILRYVHNSALVWWNCCAILVDLIYGTSFIFASTYVI